MSREMLMVALQKIEQILIRATDIDGATKAQLQGVTLDLARPTSEVTTSLTKFSMLGVRPAIGIETCQCPRKYNSTSCQNPGQGYYRWYKKNHFSSVTIIDYIGEAKRCRCNGRADHCHPETGTCLGCREHTTGDSCDICAGGFYGDPMRGKPCRPCQCPSAERNHAVTCRVNSYTKEFSCQCSPGYTGPKCNRCDYGFYGEADSDLGCLPCKCNTFGSMSDQCDQVNGQCYCVQGVTGRDCSQCQPRHILTAKRTCKNCDHECTGPLLDTMDATVKFFNDSDVSDIDPEPMLRVGKLQNRKAEYDERIERVRNTKETLSSIGSLLDSLKPRAELGMLETKRYSKAADEQDRLSSGMLTDSTGFFEDVSGMESEIASIIDHLKTYGMGAFPQVSINRALQEAREILAIIRGRGYGNVDIEARTELSYARQSLNIVTDMLYGQSELKERQAQVEGIENKVNDLLQYINRAMDKTRSSQSLNFQHHNVLDSAKKNCAEARKLSTEASDVWLGGQKLLVDAKNLLREARDGFNKLDLVYDNLRSIGGSLQEKEVGLSAVVEDYRTRYVLPCKGNADRLTKLAAQVLDTFGVGLGVNAEQTVRAARVYQKIMKTIFDARRIAGAALDMSVRAIERTREKDYDGYDLYAQADVARVRSRDLRQEADGLKQNSAAMQVQMEELILRWQSYILLMSKRSDELETVNRDLDRLQIVSVLAKESLRLSEEAFREAEAVHNKVSDLNARISQELRSKADELHSFAPDELGNIPRRLTQARRVLQQVDKQATYLSHRKIDIEEVSHRVSEQISSLRSRIEMARHAASNIKISITNQRIGHENADNTWGCSRSYRVNLTASTSNTISLIYAVDNADDRDGLLVYMPNGDPEVRASDRDFMAIEMVNRQIRFLWNNGAGTKSITHNTTIETAYGGSLVTQDHMWYKITAERVGNIGRLNVRKVKPVYVRPEYDRWVVGETLATANVFNVHRQDLLYVGGGAIPDTLRSDQLLSGGRFSGVLYNLEVDGGNIGLWNFVTNAGCRETHSGITSDGHTSSHACYSFNGHGYAVQQDMRNYDPRYLSVSMEFKTFDSNALLFFAVNEMSRQYLLVELRDGRIYMELNYGPEKQLSFLTSNTYNGGNWVKVEAARALRNNVETGVLRVTLNGVQEDLMDTIALPRTITFQMDKCYILFGGVPPNYDTSPYIGSKGRRRRLGNFLGNMRAITISNPGSNNLMNPLYTQRYRPNPFFGVEPRCDRMINKQVSFNGDGYLEVKSQPLRHTCSFGFSFRTHLANSLLLLSTFRGQETRPSDLTNYYSVSLIDGKLMLKFSSEANYGVPTSFVTRHTFNDGQSHTISVKKEGRR